MTTPSTCSCSSTGRASTTGCITTGFPSSCRRCAGPACSPSSFTSRTWRKAAGRGSHTLRTRTGSRSLSCRGKARRCGGRTDWRATLGRKTTGLTTRRCPPSKESSWPRTIGSMAQTSKGPWPRAAMAARVSRAGCGANRMMPLVGRQVGEAAECVAAFAFLSSIVVRYMIPRGQVRACQRGSTYVDATSAAHPVDEPAQN
mmetsp:Transcript_6046/g.15376  ORF Transcript_6046/g.15376 Transcript_6046/m.15376 type:complete len:201 (-) Transcript_6046:132-734(-)